MLKCLASLSLMFPTDSVKPPLSDSASPTRIEQRDGPHPSTYYHGISPAAVISLSQSGSATLLAKY